MARCMVRQPFPFSLSVQIYISHFAGTARVLTSNSLQTFRSLLPASTKRASYSRVTLVPPSGDTTSQIQRCPRNLFLTSAGTRLKTNLFSQRHRCVGVYEHCGGRRGMKMGSTPVFLYFSLGLLKFLLRLLLTHRHLYMYTP